MTLWNDPIRWSERTCGNKFMFWLSIFCHILIVFIIVFMVHLISTPNERLKIYICFFVIYGAVIAPTMYLYALRRLLIELKKEKGRNSDNEQKQ